MDTSSEKKQIGILECTHNGCIKIKLLKSGLFNRFYSYPRMNFGQRIYTASCFIPIKNAKKIEPGFKSFIIENTLHKNIELDSVTTFENSLGFEITVFSRKNNDEEKKRRSLFYILNMLISDSKKSDIKLFEIYKQKETSRNIERVYLETCDLESINFNKVKRTLESLRVYKLENPKNSKEFKENRRSFYEEQDDPANYIRRKQLNEKVIKGEPLDSKESDAFKFCQCFLEGKKSSMLKEEKKPTIEEINKTESTIKLIEQKNINRPPIDLDKIPDWILPLSKNEVPHELKKCGWKADKLFEFYIHKLFNLSFSLDSIPWGQKKETQFKKFCDGYFTVPNTNKACFFDAKAYKKGFNPSKEILKLSQNVKENAPDILAIKTLKVAYFLVISSNFSGDSKKQAGDFYKNADARLKLCNAEDLSYFAKALRKISTQPTNLRSVRWDDMLSRNDPYLSRKDFDEELERLRKRKKLF